MIIEVDTDLLNIVDNLSINQLVLLSFVLKDKNQKTNQGITPLIRLVSDSEIQDLIDRNLIEQVKVKNKMVYRPTKELVEQITPRDKLFENFSLIYPTVVVRPDGTRGFLKGNTKKCKEYYNKLIKGNLDLHNHIIDVLNYEVTERTLTGKLGYMKTMWKWLTMHEWEAIEDQMKYEQSGIQQYGTELR